MVYFRRVAPKINHRNRFDKPLRQLHGKSSSKPHLPALSPWKGRSEGVKKEFWEFWGGSVIGEGAGERFLMF
jgi:hypothetical protein